MSDSAPSVSQRLEVRGFVTVEVHGPDGVEYIEQKNLVTSAGLSLFAQALASKDPTMPNYIAFGTAATAASLSDTTLGAEVHRVAAGFFDASAGVVTIKAFLPKGSANGNTLAEVGLLNAAASGTLAARAILSSSIAKDATKAVVVTWTITLANAS